MDAATVAAANRSSKGSGGALTPANTHADPGFLPDRKKRYALDTPDQVRAAASYFSRYKGKYTPQQQRVIASAIAAAEKKFGISQAAA